MELMEISTSILDTTPFVTEMVSPPRGYPTTVTASCQVNIKILFSALRKVFEQS